MCGSREQLRYCEEVGVEKEYDEYYCPLSTQKRPFGFR